MLAWLARYYPFTFSGSLLFFTSLYLVGYAFGTLNVFAAIFAGLALLLLSGLVFDGRLQAMSMNRPDVAWESSGGLIARKPDSEQRLRISAPSPHFFFRYHYVLRGRFEAGRDASFRVREEGASTRGAELKIPLYFPVAGVARVRGRLLLKDIFGFTRVPLGTAQDRVIAVQPPLLPGKSPVQIQNAASLESSRRMRSADEEKYYMREYQPGDRLKDLNWKASFRIGEMITRIAPKSPEDSKLLHVELRHFNYAAQDSPTALMHLNVLKSWLLAFLSQVKREHPGYNFRVLTADETYLLESEADVQDFGNRLASVHYVRGGRIGNAAPSSEKFIFTTPYDRELGVALGGESGVSLNVFRTLPRHSIEGGRSTDERTVRKVRFLPLEHRVPLPGMWLFRRDAGLPPGSGPGAIPGARIYEERLAVSLVF